MKILGSFTETRSQPIRGHRRSLLLLLATSLATFPLAAQTADIPLKLDKFEVQGATGKVPPTLALSVAGATYVNSEDIGRSTARSLEDALQAVPGVQARSRAGDDVFLSLRGSGIQSIVFTKARGTDVLIDGLPINSADGNFDYSLVSPLDALSVDVFRGAAAFAFGGTTLGGAVNLVTPSGRDLNGGRLRIDMGSFGFLRGSLAYGRADKNWDAAARYTWQDEDGFRDNSAGRAHKLAANFGRRLGPALENRLYVNAAFVHQEVSLPISQAQVEADPAQAGDPTATTLPYFDVETVRVADKLVFTGADTKAEASVYYLYRYVDFRRPSVPATGYRLGPGWLDAPTDDLGALLRVTREGELFGRRNVLTAGLRLARLDGTEKLYPNVATIRGAKFADGGLTASSATAWLETDYALSDRLALVAGLQAAHSSREYKDRFNPGSANVSGSRNYDALSPQAALRWTPAPRTQFYASLSRSFEPPAFGDMIGIPIVPPPPQRISFRRLDAQDATTLEAGARSASDDGRFAWEASLYRSWLRHEIIRFDDGTQTGNQVGRNADRTLHDGLELASTARLWQAAAPADHPDELALRAAYTWNDYRFDDDPVFGHHALAGIPVQTLYAELLYRRHSGWYAGVNLTGSLRDYAADNANTYYVHDFVLVGARTGWAGRRFSLYLEARNLGDKGYVTALQNATNLHGADAAIFFPGNGRAVYVGCEWRW